jgi:hypothetical protein
MHASLDDLLGREVVVISEVSYHAVAYRATLWRAQRVNEHLHVRRLDRAQARFGPALSGWRRRARFVRVDVLALAGYLLAKHH